ncbi:hypothetical protein V6N12_024221 [Hibiscus sabdariffa]|uniref:Uncharacterized protein n=1 Tax=Hibiscus sabdariffa TaxID=183260 RepID=A0ABR2FZY4_9ROSI
MSDGNTLAFHLIFLKAFLDSHFLQFKPILPDRSTQVGISLVGPFAGAALSFSMFVVGLLLSSNPDAAGDLVQGSLLLGLISGATLGNAAKKVVLHIPSFMNLTDGNACCNCMNSSACDCRMSTTAFNMLPVAVGCLDGGRAVQVPSYSYIAFSFEIFDSSLHFLQGAFGKDRRTFTTFLGAVCADSDMSGVTTIESFSIRK